MKTHDTANVLSWLDAMAGAIKPLADSDPELAMIGIRTGGVSVAQYLHSSLGLSEPLGELNISFYRDDFSAVGLHPVVGPSSVPFNLDGRHIILVDDVLSTGRTVRAAMNEIFDYGRPSRITLAVLVERTGHELPIRADVVGLSVDIPEEQHVALQVDSMTVIIGEKP